MPDDWVFGRSESGWMRAETFFEYVANGMNDWITKNNVKRPVLFFVDGHKSHMSIELSDFCTSNNIILYALPPNTTHLMQPADVGAFKGLKNDYKKTIREWQLLPGNHCKAITKQNFCMVLDMVLKNKDRSSIIKNSFRKCGLFPFNPDAVDYSKCVQNLLESGNLLEPSTISEENYVQAGVVIKSLKNELAEFNIDYQVILKCINNAQKNTGNETIQGTYVLEENGDLTKLPSGSSFGDSVTTESVAVTENESIEKQSNLEPENEINISTHDQAPESIIDTTFDAIIDEISVQIADESVENPESKQFYINFLSISIFFSYIIFQYQLFQRYLTNRVLINIFITQNP